MAKKSKRKITPEDILQLRIVSDPQISPDGSTILYSQKHIGEKNNNVTNFWLLDCKSNESKQFTSGEKDGHGRWSSDGETIAFTSGREKPQTQIFTIPAAGGEAIRLTDFPDGSIGGFQFSPDGKLLAVTFRETEPGWTEADKRQQKESGASTPPRVIDDMYYRLDGDGYFNDKRHHLYVVDFKTGQHRKVFDKDNTGWFSFDFSPNSKELIVASNTSKNSLLKPWKDELFRVDVQTGKAKKIAGLPEGTKSSPKWSPDGKKIVYVGCAGRQEVWGVRNNHLFVLDLKTNKIQNLTAEYDYCLTSVTLSDMAEATFGANICWSPNSKSIYMQIGWHGETQIAHCSLDEKGFTFSSKGPQALAMGNLTADGSKMALAITTATSPPVIAVGEIAKSGQLKIRNTKNVNQSLLDSIEISQLEEHWVESASGTKVQLWVMKPPGFKKDRKYPAVLQVHGGPHCQYGTSFFHEFQVLAAAGYVVVFSNPRGSKGYGESHTTAIKGNWGNADWEDVQAVTQFMQQHANIKKSKIGIMGGSYGGYMTNWAIGHTDDFAAAISDRCVSNLVSMVGSSDIPLVPGGYWEGNSWDNIEPIWDQSPLKYFGNVKTPTLVIHSEGDLRCNIEQSEQVFAALQLRGIPSRFIRYPYSTSHGMSRMGPPDLRIHRLHQILDWWKQYLG